MKPEWKNAFSMKNEKYEVVETDMMIRGSIRYLNNDCREMYEKTKNPKYMQSYARLVFRTDWRTKETVGFIMTLVPDLEWLEKSKFKPFKVANYFDRGKDFGGWVLYHNMDGSFSNGWVYEKGEITGEISSLDEEPGKTFLLRSSDNGCYWENYYRQWETCTDWYSGSEEYGFNYVGTSCDYSWEYGYSVEVCPGGGDGGYGGGGGGGGSAGNAPPQPQTRTDCPPEAASHSSTINNVLDNTDINNNVQIKTFIDDLRLYASVKSVEYGLAIQYAPGEGYWLYNTAGKNNPPQYIRTGTQTNVELAYNDNTYMTVHTHPAGTYEAPSPSDAALLANAYKKNATNITANVALGYSGTEYMVYVANRQDFQNFCNNAGNSDFTVKNGSMFKQGSKWDNTYQTAYKNMFENKKYSENDARSYALSYVLDYYNTGMKVYQKKSGEFKQQKTEKSGSNYIPKICN